ncbi:MAG: glutamyl-tRNA reductase [Deltaproteobacteria bacterium]|nr:glutamyl-tRNA reductase [Deltaproteobacteria bacterium]
MGIFLVGLSHKTAPVELREKISFAEETIPQGLEKLRAESIPENIILSTCNRVEIIAQCEDCVKGISATKDFLSGEHQIPLDELEPHLYIREGNEAIRHIFRVASSLDSMMVGEPQILGQFKNAFTIASEAKATGIILNRLMHKAFSVAKRIKTETGIARSAVSISYAAVELAKKIFDDLTDKTVMLIGAGEMCELAAKHLMQNGAKKMLVTNRTYSRAVELAQEFNGSAIRFENFIESLIQTDIIISSTGAPHYILHHHDVKEVIHERRNKPIFMIDIAVPRDLDPEINKIDNVYLYDIDNLQAVVETNIEERKKEAEKADSIVTQEVRTFEQWLASLKVTPMIVLLRERMEQIRQEELRKTLPRLNGISEKEKRSIESMSMAIINKVLHGPMKALKSCHPEEKETLMQVLREIFQLEDSPRKIGEKDR